MVQTEDRLAYVAQRAYIFVRTGTYEDSAAIEREIVAEGFKEVAPWLERRGVRDPLDKICIANPQTSDEELKAKRNALAANTSRDQACGARSIPNCCKPAAGNHADGRFQTTLCGRDPPRALST
jgi:hypothetical protein